MFDNIGEKIKGSAGIVALIGILSSIIGGIFIMDDVNNMVVIGLIVIAAGSFASCLSACVLYGFGQLIENTDKLLALQSGNSPESVNNDLPDQ